MMALSVVLGVYTTWTRYVKLHLMLQQLLPKKVTQSFTAEKQHRGPRWVLVASCLASNCALPRRPSSSGRVENVDCNSKSPPTHHGQVSQAHGKPLVPAFFCQAKDPKDSVMILNWSMSHSSYDLYDLIELIELFENHWIQEGRTSSQWSSCWSLRCFCRKTFRKVWDTATCDWKCQ